MSLRWKGLPTLIATELPIAARVCPLPVPVRCVPQFSVVCGRQLPENIFLSSCHSARWRHLPPRFSDPIFLDPPLAC